MKKKELIRIVSKETKLNIRDSGLVLESVLSNIIKSVIEKECLITLPGFGTFEKFERKPRICRNPSTGEKIKVGSKNAVRFRPGSKFKQKLAES